MHTIRFSPNVLDALLLTSNEYEGIEEFNKDTVAISKFIMERVGNAYMKAVLEALDNYPKIRAKLFLMKNSLRRDRKSKPQPPKPRKLRFNRFIKPSGRFIS